MLNSAKPAKNCTHEAPLVVGISNENDVLWCMNCGAYKEESPQEKWWVPYLTAAVYEEGTEK